ncbi:BspA family leucine-rich repeat surface protein [Reichenbachiella versicolor]|uniref:BspA family leucine-rich repeat surface protein n=1 Tax=Reichenbachiella versicolor TaxID=1821036 RepID=UPI000D6E8E22|nr:BspA family leucine-rich repeat surface protein [Reichenbachiella versicolor]
MNYKNILLLIFILFSWNTQAQMILQYDTNLSSGTTITLPLQGEVTATIEWGDASLQIITEAGNIDHTYDTDGIYTVIVKGSLEHFGNYNADNAEKLVSVKSFDVTELTDLSFAFKGARNLTNVPKNIPSDITDVSGMFYSAYSFNQDISSWDVSNIITMDGMFFKALTFNQNLNKWSVSNVTSMVGMFEGASVFNQNISNWDVSQVTNMKAMFHKATSFNQDISNWNVRNVTDMEAMFRGASSFNPSIIDNWNISNKEDLF